MGKNCAPLLFDLSFDELFGHYDWKSHRKLARSFTLKYDIDTFDDLIVFNNKKFSDYLSEIDASQLTVEKANKSDHLTSSTLTSSTSHL